MENLMEDITKVRKIQRNVRAWLIRRQQQDIKTATSILQTEINTKINKHKTKIAVSYTHLTLPTICSV